MTSFDRLTLTLVGHPLTATAEERGEEGPSAGMPERMVWSADVAVNDKPIFQSRVILDVLALLFDGANTGELTLLSCTCGVPECAGFMEPVSVKVTPSEDASGGWQVSWHLPLCGYARCVTPEGGAGPWTFRFERSQVLTELERFSQSLVAQHERTGPLYISPSEPFSEFEKPLTRLPQLIAQALEHRQSWPTA